MNPIVRRQQATQKTLDRYRNKTLDFSRGITCVHMARYHLRALGHRPRTMPRIRSVMGAKRALASNGWDSVKDMFDSMLPRIAPARMMVGDLGTIPGEHGLDSVLVCAGPFKMLGWHPETGEFVQYDGGNAEVEGVWSV